MTTPSPDDAGADIEVGGPAPTMPPPEPDQVSGPDTDVMHGLVIDYTYSGGRRYRLMFDHDHRVAFEMPDLPADVELPVLTYRARELRPGLVLVHWIVKPAAIHVALTIDLDQQTLHVAAMMPPNRWEFFDTAVIDGVTRT